MDDTNGSPRMVLISPESSPVRTVSLPSAIMRSLADATLHAFLRERPEPVSMLLRATRLDRTKPRAHGIEAKASVKPRQRISLSL